MWVMATSAVHRPVQAVSDERRAESGARRRGDHLVDGLGPESMAGRTRHLADDTVQSHAGVATRAVQSG